MSRLEDQIRRLSTELSTVKDDSELGLILAELREALHRYIERLRTHLASYPWVIERRVQKETPGADTQRPDDAIPEPTRKKTSTRTTKPEQSKPKPSGKIPRARAPVRALTHP